MPPTTTSYRTIKADLLTRIQAGEFPPGTRLPDEIDLAERFGVARTTVARAMRELARLPQPFTTSQARQAWDTTRRVAIPLLEHLDAKGWTRREDGTRRSIVR